jgi:hypothetical protein
MEISIPWLFWLFPVAFAIHNIEEALWLPAWSKSAGKFHKPVGTFEFRFAVLALTALSVTITLWFCLSGKQSPASYLFFAFNFVMLLNVLFPHFAATVTLRKYCPGLLTGVLLLAPTTGYLLLFGYHHGYLIFPTFWFVAIPFTALLAGSIPVLFSIGKLFQRALGREQ